MKRFCVFFLALPCLLMARKVALEPHPKKTQAPWFTGPLLSPSAIVVPLGHINYEPYLYVIGNRGSYNGDWHLVKNSSTLWNVSFQPLIQVGLSSWANFEISPYLNYNYTRHAGKWTFGDFPLLLSIQLYAPKDAYHNLPYVKLQIQETFPTGKYRNLDPRKKGTDIGGAGSFNTAIGLVLGQLFHLRGVHFLTSRLYFQYSLPAPVRLKGFNAYGGGYGTNARFFPSQVFSIDASIELSLTRRWVFACDAVGSWMTKTKVTGNPGVTKTGAKATLGSGSGAQFALAPALEYNWNESLGMIGGCWFVFAGRNATQFYSAVIAVDYYR